MNTANFLTIPATIVPDQEIVVFGDCRQTYQDTTMRVQRLAAALADLGITPGDAVAVLETPTVAHLDLFRHLDARGRVRAAELPRPSG